MPTTIQLPPGRPLLPFGALMVALDCEEDRVLELIDSGKLLWAWDIKHPQAKRRALRVWADCLAARLAFEKQPSETETGIITKLLPDSRPTFKISELARLFTCSRSHIQNLAAEGELNEVKKPAKGQYGEGEISRESVIGFLKRRRVL